MVSAALPVALLVALSGGRNRGISQDQAEMIIYCVAGAGGLAWLLTLLAWARLSSPRPGESREVDARGGVRLTSTRVKIVSGEPADVADGLVRALASPSRGACPLLVKREGDGLLAAVPAGKPAIRSVPCFSSCAVELRRLLAGQTEVTFRMEFSGVRRAARRAAGVLMALGLLVLIVLPGLLYFFAAGASSGAARFQVVQAVHAGHLLWPPWLIFALYRRGRRATEIYLDSAANNASVLGEAFAASRARGEVRDH